MARAQPSRKAPEGVLQCFSFVFTHRWIVWVELPAARTRRFPFLVEGDHLSKLNSLNKVNKNTSLPLKIFNIHHVLLVSVNS